MTNRNLDVWIHMNIFKRSVPADHDINNRHCDCVPRYTESISDAFQVVEKMKEGGWFFILWNDSITNWAAGFDKDILQAEFNSVLEETIPLAICLAAKAAIEGVE